MSGRCRRIHGCRVEPGCTWWHQVATRTVCQRPVSRTSIVVLGGVSDGLLGLYLPLCTQYSKSTQSWRDMAGVTASAAAGGRNRSWHISMALNDTYPTGANPHSARNLCVNVCRVDSCILSSSESVARYRVHCAESRCAMSGGEANWSKSIIGGDSSVGPHGRYLLFAQPF